MTGRAGSADAAGTLRGTAQKPPGKERPRKKEKKEKVGAKPRRKSDAADGNGKVPRKKKTKPRPSLPEQQARRSGAE